MLLYNVFLECLCVGYLGDTFAPAVSLFSHVFELTVFSSKQNAPNVLESATIIPRADANGSSLRRGYFVHENVIPVALVACLHS